MIIKKLISFITMIIIHSLIPFFEDDAGCHIRTDPF